MSASERELRRTCVREGWIRTQQHKPFFQPETFQHAKLPERINVLNGAFIQRPSNFYYVDHWQGSNRKLWVIQVGLKPDLYPQVEVPHMIFRARNGKRLYTFVNYFTAYFLRRDVKPIANNPAHPEYLK